MSKPTRVIGKAAAQRVIKSKADMAPSLLAAGFIGVAAALVTYKLLRGG
jgi:hypothetical protein